MVYTNTDPRFLALQESVLSKAKTVLYLNTSHGHDLFERVKNNPEFIRKYLDPIYHSACEFDTNDMIQIPVNIAKSLFILSQFINKDGSSNRSIDITTLELKVYIEHYLDNTYNEIVNTLTQKETNGYVEKYSTFIAAFYLDLLPNSTLNNPVKNGFRLSARFDHSRFKRLIINR